MSRRPAFTAEEAAEIRRSYLETGMNLTQVARLYRTSPTTVSKIVDGLYRPRPSPRAGNSADPFCQENHPMQVLSLEIQRNTSGYRVTILGQAEVPPGELVGRVKLGGDGAEIVTPLSPAQIEAVLGAIAHTAAHAALTLVDRVSAATFQGRHALEHAPEPPSPPSFSVSWDEEAAPAPAPAPAPVEVSLEQPLADVARTADPIEAADPLRLPLVVGGVYATRGGEIARIVRILTDREAAEANSNYPVTFTLDDGLGDEESSTREGGYYSTGEEHRLDLVTRLTDDARTTALTTGDLAPALADPQAASDSAADALA